MQLVRYNPWRDLTRHERDLDMALEETWDSQAMPAPHDQTTVDMYTENGKLLIEIALPGFTREEIRLSTSTSALDVTAAHKDKIEGNAKREYLMHESNSAC